MKEKAPLHVRALLLLDRIMSAMWRTSVMVRDETLWAWTSKPGRERTNRAVYSGLPTYFPGGATFEDGLFPWEREAICSSFPPSGRILLGAAGGGRELVELLKMGYEVVAFESAPALAEAARAVASAYPESKVISASYADIVLAAREGSGPLAPHVCGKEFDGVIFGWISLSYIWREDRDALLKALRALVPHAPILLSYYLGDGDCSEGRLGKVRLRFRRLLRLTGAPALAEPGDLFQPWAGFFQALTLEEVQSLAERTGYKLVYVKGSPSPHAIFAPGP